MASTLTNNKERLSGFPQILLRRDNHRCVVSAYMDMDFWEEARLSDDIPVGLTGTLVSFHIHMPGGKPPYVSFLFRVRRLILTCTSKR